MYLILFFLLVFYNISLYSPEQDKKKNEARMRSQVKNRADKCLGLNFPIVFFFCSSVAQVLTRSLNY